MDQTQSLSGRAGPISKLTGVVAKNPGAALIAIIVLVVILVAGFLYYRGVGGFYAPCKGQVPSGYSGPVGHAGSGGPMDQGHGPVQSGDPVTSQLVQSINQQQGY